MTQHNQDTPITGSGDGGQAIPDAIATDALRFVAGWLRVGNGWSNIPDAVRDMHELVVAVMIDLASNIETGVSELWRSDTGYVFITTGAIERVGSFPAEVSDV